MSFLGGVDAMGFVMGILVGGFGVGAVAFIMTVSLYRDIDRTYRAQMKEWCDRLEERFPRVFGK